MKIKIENNRLFRRFFLFPHKNLGFSQAMIMKKIKVYESDGRTRDERETCFPNAFPKDKMQGAGTR